MKRILVAPLDWGLGHATRCIPIIRELLSHGCEVFVAGSGDSLLLLKQEFSNLSFFQLTGYDPIYPANTNMVRKMALQLPKFIRTIKKEHREVAVLVEKLKIDIVISDNRYGCWSSKVPSVFVTHQVNILMPKGYRWLEKIVNAVQKWMMKKFTWCWVPDYEDVEQSLAGKLSRSDKRDMQGITYVGPLSRFVKSGDAEIRYDVTCVLSGPEPQRSIFEIKIIQQLKEVNLRHFIVRGVIEHHALPDQGEAAFLNSGALQAVIEQSGCIIARSGYSTIMDLLALGKRAILVPTPGQTEQEYLAAHWRHKGVYTVKQNHFNLSHDLLELRSYGGFKANVNNDKDALSKAVGIILKSMQ
jgi:uncharacterized protein (TIGR00661 family)